MMRLLMTASAIATLAIPALAVAHQDQNPPRPERPASAYHPAARPVNPGGPNRPAMPGAPIRPGFDHQRFNPSARVVQRPGWNHGNPNWWRGRPEFRGYGGIRPGFWFRPGFGYVRVDPRWYGYSWRVGGFVPPAFRGYYVQNAGIYGLPPAPYGYAYVYLNNNIALMAISTGLIVQVLPGIF